MDIGTRVRLSLPQPGYASARGEVIDEARSPNGDELVQIKWDNIADAGWFLTAGLVPVD